MGQPGQLFKFLELTSVDEKTGEEIKKDAIAAITAASAKHISRIIIVTRKGKPGKAKSASKKKSAGK
jgi:hypothetical protein